MSGIVWALFCSMTWGTSSITFRTSGRASCASTSRTCRHARHLLPAPPTPPIVTNGPCSFNYFSHAVGVGLRYNTPIGPIRFDFAVNLDPPYYPIYRYVFFQRDAGPTPPYHIEYRLLQIFLQHRAELLMRRADLKRESVRWLAAARWRRAARRGTGADCGLGRCALQRCAFGAAADSAGQRDRGHQWRCIAAERSADRDGDGRAGAVEPARREELLSVAPQGGSSTARSSCNRCRARGW